MYLCKSHLQWDIERITPSLSRSFFWWWWTIRWKTGHLSKRCRGSCQSSFAQGHPVSWDVQQQRRDAVADREQRRPEIGWLWQSVLGYKTPINFEKLGVQKLPVPELRIWFHTECWSSWSQDDLTVSTYQYSLFSLIILQATPKSLLAQDNLNSIPWITLPDLSPRPFHRFPTRGDNDRPVAM